MEKDKLLTAHELALLLNLSVETIWRYTRENRIPFMEVGTRQYRYNEQAVLDALNKDSIVIREKPAEYEPGKKVTHEDYARLPFETGYTIELVEGSLIREPSPSVHHQRVSIRLQMILFNYFVARDPGAEVLDAPLDLYLDEYTVVQPDLLYFPGSRPATETPVRSLPELTVEISSPSSGRIDRVRKLNSYQKAKIPHYWIVDPVDSLIECYKLQEGGYLSVVRFSEGNFTHPSFPDLTFDLEALFSKPQTNLNK